MEFQASFAGFIKREKLKQMNCQRLNHHYKMLTSLHQNCYPQVSWFSKESENQKTQRITLRHEKRTNKFNTHVMSIWNESKLYNTVYNTLVLQCTNEKRVCKACKTIIFKLNMQIHDILNAFILFENQHNVYRVPNTQVSVSTKCPLQHFKWLQLKAPSH